MSTPAPDRPEIDREAIYGLLYEVWPEWLGLEGLADSLDGQGVTPRASDAAISLCREGRVEQGFHGYRVRMGLADG